MGQVQKLLDNIESHVCCCTVLELYLGRSRGELRGTVDCVCRYMMYRVCLFM